MPKVNVDYSNTIIYKIACKDQTIKDIYVGHTTNFTQRKYSHKTNCINEKSTNYKLKVYEFIRNNGGWENWEMIEICSINCKNKLDALRWEHEYYYLLNATLNNVQPFSYKNNEKEMNNSQTISSQVITSDHDLRNEIILENNNIINNIVLNN